MKQAAGIVCRTGLVRWTIPAAKHIKLTRQVSLQAACHPGASVILVARGLISGAE